MSYDICPKCARPTFRCECGDRRFGEEPIRAEHRAVMTDIARHMDEIFNHGEQTKKYGFALLVFDFGSGGYMNYISNADRNTMLQAMREFIDRNLQQN